MINFSKSFGNSLLTMAVALGVMSPLTASAEIIRTPFAGMPKPTVSNLKAHPAPAADVQSGFQPLWSTDVTMADAEGDCEESQMRRLADGGYIAGYTCGGGENILEGRVVRLNAAGEKLWETAVQAEINTTVNKVCQGEDGRFYALGTTVSNGFTQSYIACLDGNGKQVYLTINEDNVAILNPTEITTAGDKVAIIYITNTASYNGTKTLTARWFDNTGKQTNELLQPVTTATTEYVSRLGDFLMVPMFSADAFAIDLKNASIALHAQQEYGSVYYNGCANEDALFTLHKNASSMLVLTKYQIEDGALVEKWNCTTRQENTGYDSFAYPLNEGKVIIYNKSRQYGPGIAIIAADGSREQDKAEVNFGDYNSAWAYAAAQGADGTIYIFGMFASGMTYGLSVLTTDANLNNPQATVYDNLDPGYTLFYSQYDHSYYTDNEFVFSGYMRPEDYNSHGYTPIFGTYSITDNQMKLLYTGDPGSIAKIEAGEMTVDANFNVYATMTSNAQSVLIKYNAEGEQEWVRYLNSEGKLFKPVILSNGNICTGTYSNGLQAVCYTPNGDVVYDVKDETVSNTLSYLRSAFAVEGEDNSLIIATSGYNATTYLGMPYVAKVDAEGNVSSKLVTDYEYSTNVEGITSDKDGNAYILGNTSNVDGISLPIIIKIDSNLEVKKAFTQDIDVHCPLYFGAIGADGRIYVVGNTWYHGMLFVYDKDFNMLGYHIFEDSTYTQSEYESLSLNADGDALISANYQDENYNRYGMVLCYNDKAELQWRFNRTTEGAGYHYIYNAAQNGDDVIAVGIRNSAVGIQSYVMVLNAEQQIEKEFYMPQDKGYSSYAFGSSDIIGGNAYVESTFRSGKAMFGNVTCFGDASTVSVEQLPAIANEDSIVIENGQASLTCGSEALWEVYTADGAKIVSSTATNLNLGNLNGGIYIITAKNADKTYTAKITK